LHLCHAFDWAYAMSTSVSAVNSILLLISTNEEIITTFPQILTQVIYSWYSVIPILYADILYLKYLLCLSKLRTYWLLHIVKPRKIKWGRKRHCQRDIKWIWNLFWKFRSKSNGGRAKLDWKNWLSNIQNFTNDPLKNVNVNQKMDYKKNVAGNPILPFQRWWFLLLSNASKSITKW